MKSFSLSGDWTGIAPGVRVRLRDAPGEEDMEHYEPQPRGVVILQVEEFTPAPPRLAPCGASIPHPAHGIFGGPACGGLP